MLKKDTFTFLQITELISSELIVGADAKLLAEDVGLSGCYALMGTKIIMNEDGTQTQIVKLRSPNSLRFIEQFR